VQILTSVELKIHNILIAKVPVPEFQKHRKCFKLSLKMILSKEALMFL
jgi:hypothetical protein